MIVLDVDDELGERLELQPAASEPAGVGEEGSGGDARHVVFTRGLAGAFTGRRGGRETGLGVGWEVGVLAGAGVSASDGGSLVVRVLGSGRKLGEESGADTGTARRTQLGGKLGGGWGLGWGLPGVSYVMTCLPVCKCEMTKTHRIHIIATLLISAYSNPHIA